MALSGILQSFFILVIVLLYTATVWRSLDSYFKEEFKKHLAKDYKSIQKLKRNRLEMAKESIETNNVLDALDGVNSKLTEETMQKLSAEIPSGCKEEKNPENKYTNQEEIEEDCLDEGDICPFTPPTDIHAVGGG